MLARADLDAASWPELLSKHGLEETEASIAIIAIGRDQVSLDEI